MSPFNETNLILELFSFDLTTFFVEDDFEIIECKEESCTFMVEYEKNLPWFELDLFDKVIFRVFNDKKNFTGSSHVNLKLPAPKEIVTKDKIKHLTNEIVKKYGKDDNKNNEWNQQDDKNFDNKNFERYWTCGNDKYVYAIKLTQNKKGDFDFSILFFNNLLKIINQTVSFSLQ